MGFMDAWEKWSLKQWLSWGSGLQNKYDEYRELKTPDWYLQLTDGVWDRLSDEVKDYLNKTVIETVKHFDTDFAKELIDKIVDRVKKTLHID